MTSCRAAAAPGYILLNLDKSNRRCVYKLANLYTIASMRMIPLNPPTLYSDLVQRITTDDVQAASITCRMVGGQRRIYATFPGGVRKQVYLGTAGDRKAGGQSNRADRAANDARQIARASKMRSGSPTWRKHFDAALKNVARTPDAPFLLNCRWNV